MPFWIPAAIAAGSTLFGELFRDRRASNIGGVKYQRPDFGAQRQALYGGLGTQATAAGRSAGMALGSDPGRMASVGQGINADMMRAYVQGLGGIQSQENLSRQQESEFNLRKAQYLDEYRRKQPGFLDSLAGGVGIASSLYPLMYPKQFVPQFGGGQFGGLPFGGGGFGGGQQFPYLGLSGRRGRREFGGWQSGGEQFPDYGYGGWGGR